MDMVRRTVSILPFPSSKLVWQHLAILPVHLASKSSKDCFSEGVR